MKKAFCVAHDVDTHAPNTPMSGRPRTPDWVGRAMPDADHVIPSVASNERRLMAIVRLSQSRGRASELHA